MTSKRFKITILCILVLVFVFGTMDVWTATGEKVERRGAMTWAKNFIKATFNFNEPWFKKSEAPLFVILVLMALIIISFIFIAQSGKEIYIRKIAGLAAIDDAVGRATEMGRPILYISGIMDMDDIQTLAGIGILGHVAQKAAEYETPIIVPCSRSMVMSTSQEVVKESFIRVGRPDAYDRDSVKYITDDQFGFAAGVDGIMIRERPAATFYLGTFYAESLILAETGHHVGAIQIAGTAMPSQLPFFITACDYTLIGEELFAASAYISREPQMLGGLIGQDWVKIICFIIMLLGSFCATTLSVLYKQAPSKLAFNAYPIELDYGRSTLLTVTVKDPVSRLENDFPLQLKFALPEKYNKVLSLIDTSGNVIEPYEIKKEEAFYKVEINKPVVEYVNKEILFKVQNLNEKKPAEFDVKFFLEGMDPKDYSVHLKTKVAGGTNKTYSRLKSFIEFFSIKN